jgi:hypothetical protein
MSADNLTPHNIKKAQELLLISLEQIPNSNEWNIQQQQLCTILRYMTCPPAPNKSTRLKYYSSGIYEQVIIPILQCKPGLHREDTLIRTWCIIQKGVVGPDSSTKDNLETLSLGVELGFIELALQELILYRHDGRILEYAFLALNEPSLTEEHVHRIISNQIPRACLQLISKHGANIHDSSTMLINIRWAVRVLNGVALYHVEALRDLIGLDNAVKQFVPLLRNDDEIDDDLIMLGFSSARLLIRVYGKDHSSRVIEDNPDALEFFVPLMRKIMDVGFNKSYSLYHTYWRINGLMVDLAIVALSDTNKKLLVPIVPLVIEMMRFHHHDDHELIHNGMIFLSEVVLDKACLAEMKNNSKSLEIIYQVIVDEKSYEKETVALLGVVMNEVYDGF